jgi:hypothetical protein
VRRFLETQSSALLNKLQYFRSCGPTGFHNNDCDVVYKRGAVCPDQYMVMHDWGSTHGRRLDCLRMLTVSSTSHGTILLQLALQQLCWTLHQIMATPFPRPRPGDLRLGNIHRLVAAQFSHGGEMLHRGPKALDD